MTISMDNALKRNRHRAKNILIWRYHIRTT